MFNSKEEAENIRENEKGRARHFLKPDEIISLEEDFEIAVSSQ